ncbi:MULTISPECIES: sigma-54-dependent Fis family transcriptional regulator [unclassified Sporosarcina]|uniref:sigma-54-dependent Fis family transcriptional regulator n=1 Tax=unclassified Sporosarcina TaxID=2647733 RepID=UPI000C16EEE5|nr:MULTISPECIES: sigma-54-dependent Fis family transcriptional regulator [unclassified Sporosarcina]PID04055.1 sigma-54-dependent Fis family transcriptional regulator [Sporosarcina sp. P2]PID25047.1 sigma-54-dependent Fis family transcriptional regulator [Sporosarcina sp. P7]
MFELQNLITPVRHYLLPESTLQQAIESMKQAQWNTIPVINDSDQVVGVFTRTSLYDALLEGKPMDTMVRTLMKKDVITFLYDSSNELMQNKLQNSKVGMAIVVDEEGKVVGQVTKTDIIFSLLETTKSLQKRQEEILDISGLGALVIDRHHRIIYSNPKFCLMSNYKESELLHTDITTVISKIQLESMLQSKHYRLRIGEFNTLARISVHEMSQDETGHIILFQDITDVEKMAQELQTVLKLKSIMQTVINNTYDGLIMIDEFELITFISPSLQELFELEEEQILHRSVNDIFPQLELSKAIKSGISEFSDMMEINGIRYTVHRIPVYQDDEMIGVIGKISFRGLNEMEEVFKRFEKSEMSKQKVATKQRETTKFTVDQIITQDEQMEKIIRSIFKMAKGTSTVLIRGDSGTGKELFAHSVHSSSARKDKPFVIVNCAAIPEHLLESEFFGYEEGAFTGAKQKGQKGKFELANGGTLFLDEVGDMSLQLQTKMLRVLQDKEFYRVGGVEQIQVDVRIIAATNRPLEEMVASGEFREDLFYRLNVISFEIPPLRQRKNDVLLLSKSFIKDLNRLNGVSITGIDPLAEQVMMDYDWPGNVRELRNVLERATIFADHGKIELEDLPQYVVNKVGMPAGIEHEETKISLLETAERKTIVEALEKTNGNKSQAAILLGMSRSVLYNRIKKYQLDGS